MLVKGKYKKNVIFVYDVIQNGAKIESCEIIKNNNIFEIYMKNDAEKCIRYLLYDIPWQRYLYLKILSFLVPGPFYKLQTSISLLNIIRQQISNTLFRVIFHVDFKNIIFNDFTTFNFRTILNDVIYEYIYFFIFTFN